MKTELPPGLLRAARFVLIPWRAGWSWVNAANLLGAPPVGSLPHLDPSGLARWQQEIASAEVYLEYGSGGSTVAAAQSASHVVSVDSDAKFLAAVQRRVEQTQTAHADVRCLPIDIGLTEKWGRPVIEWPTSARLARWRRYTAAPWEYLESRSLAPDFIFVDGRFRVACVLESLLRLPDAAKTRIMLDDFARRTNAYAAVLEFAEAERVGRTLILRRKAVFDRDGCRNALSAYQRDPD
jgi:hypothetical protein